MSVQELRYPLNHSFQTFKNSFRIKIPENTCRTVLELPMLFLSTSFTQEQVFFAGVKNKNMSNVKYLKFFFINYFSGIKVQDEIKYKAVKSAMSDQEFRNFLDSAGHMVKPEEFRISIYQGGCEPSLRRVAWRHLLNVFPHGLSGKERFEYLKKKEKEYFDLREHWKKEIQEDLMSEEMKFVTSMVKKDVLRTDRGHKFYSGSDDNKNLISLFNVLVTFALSHPETSYCQGMSDIASILLVTQKDEAQAYLCFCALMKRLKDNFNINGHAITMKFKHLSDLLHLHDPELHSYFQEINASDLFFCYRWILLELKREFPFEEALYMLEVMWSTLPPDPPITGVPLTAETLSTQNLSRSPNSSSFGMKQTVYAKLFAMRRQKSVLKSKASYEGDNVSELELAQNSVNNNSRTISIVQDESNSVMVSQEYPAMIDTESEIMAERSSSIDGYLKSPVEGNHHFKSDLQNSLHEKESSEDSDKSIPEHSDINLCQTPGFDKQNDIKSNVEGELHLERSIDTYVERNEDPVDRDCEQSQFHMSLDESLENEPRASAGVNCHMNAEAVGKHSSVSADPFKNISESSCNEHSSTISESLAYSDTEDFRKRSLEAKSFSSSSMSKSDLHLEERADISNSMEIVKHDDKNACLPAPQDFGCGNPFLMFLCLSLLQQHRDHILQKRLEYDEIAIMFDKLVRKHDVHKVLHYGRNLYSEYLRTQQKINDSSEGDPSV